MKIMEMKKLRVGMVYKDKMYFIDEFETELSKREIIEKLRDITEPDKFWHVYVDGKFFCRAKFEDNGLFCL